MGAVPCIEYTLQEHWSMPIHPEIFMAVGDIFSYLPKPGSDRQRGK